MYEGRRTVRAREYCRGLTDGSHERLWTPDGLREPIIWGPMDDWRERVLYWRRWKVDAKEYCMGPTDGSRERVSYGGRRTVRTREYHMSMVHTREYHMGPTDGSRERVSYGSRRMVHSRDGRRTVRAREYHTGADGRFKRESIVRENIVRGRAREYHTGPTDGSH